MGPYGPDSFQVTSNNGSLVDAKYLKDSNGNYILNKNGTPYIVPADFDLDALVKKYTYVPGIFVEDGQRFAVYKMLIDGFSRGGSDELQRTYNGIVNGDFVRDFKDAASYALGKACEAAEVDIIECLVAGGVYNVLTRFGGSSNKNIDISGIFGNNPDNVWNILKGYDGNNPEDSEVKRLFLLQQYPPSDSCDESLIVPWTDIPCVAVNKDDGTRIYLTIEKTPSGWTYSPLGDEDIQTATQTGAYVVQSGNVIGDIAAKFNTTPETLVDINGIPESRITRDGNGTITHVEIYPDEVIYLPPPTNSFTLSTDTTGNGEITPDNGIFMNDTLYELAIPEPENYAPAYQDMTYLATDGYRLYDTSDHQTLQVLQNDAYPSETNYDPVEDLTFTEIEPADPTYTDGYSTIIHAQRIPLPIWIRPPARQDGNFTLLHFFSG